MTTKAFVEQQLAKGLTKYRVAKNLGLAPVSVYQYLRGTKMSRATADTVLAIYGVEITDVHE